jgi:hypothetical protein
MLPRPIARIPELNDFVSDGSLENVFGFYRRYVEAVKTDRVPLK